MRKPGAALREQSQFGATNSSCTSRTVERTMREVITTAKVAPHEQGALPQKGSRRNQQNNGR